MAWFVASIVSCIEVIGGQQSSFPIYEDFYLFEAEGKEELDNKIKETMKLIEKAGDCTLSGKAARQRSVGVRKIRSVYNVPPLDIDLDRPGDGTELTHSFFTAQSIRDVESFARGDAVTLLCVDDADVDAGDG
jgi:hypothetical protein